ncbi:MAG: S-methyl-5'-thioadenosine phosphorylase, partial [Phycisphaerales bacterium]
MKIAIIGGSGMEERLNAAGLLKDRQTREIQTPFGNPSGPIVLGTLAGADVPLVILRRHGEGHGIPPHRIPWRANIFALKALGVTHIIATGAVGSLREHIRPGELVLCDQFIDRTTGAGTRGQERTFFDNAAVHVEFADPCCPVMRDWLVDASRASETKTHRAGTYVVIDGPTFSTRAEASMHRAMGADVVGMTALPEARLAREAEIAYALIALPTDDDCWRPAQDQQQGQSPESLLQTIIGNLKQSAEDAFGLIESALRDLSPLADRPSPAHDALRLAVWTPESHIA